MLPLRSRRFVPHIRRPEATWSRVGFSIYLRPDPKPPLRSRANFGQLIHLLSRPGGVHGGMYVAEMLRSVEGNQEAWVSGYYSLITFFASNLEFPSANSMAAKMYTQYWELSAGLLKAANSLLRSPRRALKESVWWLCTDLLRRSWDLIRTSGGATTEVNLARTCLQLSPKKSHLWSWMGSWDCPGTQPAAFALHLLDVSDSLLEDKHPRREYYFGVSNRFLLRPQQHRGAVMHLWEVFMRLEEVGDGIISCTALHLCYLARIQGSLGKCHHMRLCRCSSAFSVLIGFSLQIS